jgi:hypothetical protein
MGIVREKIALNPVLLKGRSGETAASGGDVVVRRPLYVLAAGRTTVDLDGPAFLVRRQGRADARYPLARVSRVIASTQVEWSTGALAACLENGIPVVITGSGNAPVGYLLPSIQAPSRLGGELEEFIDRPDWKERYADWLRAERMRVFFEWRRRREGVGNPLPQEVLRELKRRYVYLDDRSERLSLNGLLSAAIRATVAEQLQKAGLSAVYWGFRGEPLHLLEDVSWLIELVLHFEWHGLGEKARFEGAALLRVFHTLARTLSVDCNSVLGHLHHYVKSFLEEWR